MDKTERARIRSNVDNASEKWCKKFEVGTFVLKGGSKSGTRNDTPFCLSASTEGYCSSCESRLRVIYKHTHYST